MSTHNKKKLAFLKRVSKKNLKYQKKLFSKCPSQIIEDIGKISHSVCNNNKIKLTTRQIGKLVKYKKFLRGINKTRKNKRGYLVRNIQGGFISALIPLVLTIASAIGNNLL